MPGHDTVAEILIRDGGVFEQRRDLLLQDDLADLWDSAAVSDLFWPDCGFKADALLPAAIA